MNKYNGETTKYLSQKGGKNIEIDLMCQPKEGIKAFECKWIDRKIDNKIIYQFTNKINEIKQFEIKQLGFFVKKETIF